jgi:3-hydroxyacyl-[acyl-carrier-protein] dehydratase
MSETTNVHTAEPAVTTEKSGPLDINQIQAILPHRYPFLLIDRVLEIERKKKIVAIKNVTINEPFFAGHFPGFPIMPGVLIMEAMAQAGGAMLLTEVTDRSGKLIVFTGIEKARFRRPVVPGDQLRIEVEMLTWKEISSRIAVRMGGKAYVNGKLVCDGIVSAQLVAMNRGSISAESPTGTKE